MHDLFYHEALYRGAKAMARLADVRVAVCGAGAVGSNLIENLVRQGLRQVTAIDFDRVQARNVGTQTYALDDVGAFKVDVLQAEVFRTVGVEIATIHERLTQGNVGKLLAGADLVIDGLDNHASRALVTEHCRKSGIPCLHVGLSADYAEVIWNENYRVPPDVVEPGTDVCDYPLARNLIQFAVTLASEAVLRYVLEGQRQNASFTLCDLKITAAVAGSI